MKPVSHLASLGQGLANLLPAAGAPKKPVVDMVSTRGEIRLP